MSEVGAGGAAEGTPQPDEQGQKEQLLSEMREFAQTLRQLEGDRPTEEIWGPKLDLPKVVRDRRQRPVEVWDRLGRRMRFFYPAESNQPYAYQIADINGVAIEQGSTAGAGRMWVVQQNAGGLAESYDQAAAMPHSVSRVEVMEDGSMLMSAADGYQLRRDTSGVDFESFYDANGCLTEAIRRDDRGVHRTTWKQETDGSSIATEYRPDGSVVLSVYDTLGRLLSRSAGTEESQVNVKVAYDADGSYQVTREEQEGRVVEYWRRKDGTLSRSKSKSTTGGEVIERSYDQMERMVREERISEKMSQVTTWRYGEDGWTEVTQSNSNGGTLQARYDQWGRLIVQKETGPSGSGTVSYVYKPDGSYRLNRKTSDGLEVDEYYRADGKRHYSKAKYPDGREVEIDHEQPVP